MPFFKRIDGVYRTSVKHILLAKKFFEEQPEGIIQSGMWAEPEWTKRNFYAWFYRCLLHKCGGSDYTDKEADLILDGHKVNMYYRDHVRNSGANYLTTAKMKRRYPHIDNPNFEHGNL